MRDCLIRNRMGSDRWLAFIDSHSSSKERSMNGAQFHPPGPAAPVGDQEDCKRGDAGESLITDLTGRKPADGVRRLFIENEPGTP